MGKFVILEPTIKKPITYIGQCAGIAYNSDTSDPDKNFKRGLQCILDGHGRMLEFCDVYMSMEEYSIRVMREFMRHVSDGLTAIQRSTRYCNEGDFKYYTPPSIKKNEGALSVYENAMAYVEQTYQELTTQYGVKKEDAANILPLGMHTEVLMKKNVRALIDMSKVRLCNRAYVEYRQLMRDMMKALSEYSEEWDTLISLTFKSKCEISGYCDEHMSCGKYPKKNN